MSWQRYMRYRGQQPQVKMFLIERSSFTSNFLKAFKRNVEETKGVIRSCKSKDRQQDKWQNDKQ